MKMIYLPAHEIIGEGEFYFIVVVFPLGIIAFIHSLFLQIDNRLPIFYGIGVGFLLICEAIAYRIHFQCGNTFWANSAVLLAAIILTAASACIFYLVPFLKWSFAKLLQRQS